MKQIQKAITDRHNKELEMKNNMKQAEPNWKQFKESVMRDRKNEHQK